MPATYLKDIFREIKISLGRFLSILCIVAIGVAFFAGIKASAPDMKNSADTYFDKYNVQDIQVYSTIGLTKKDVAAIKKIKGVKSVQPSFSMDTLSQIDSTQMVIKVISYGIDQKMNKIRVVEGRMPERENECLVEASSATNKLYGTFHIGDTIKLQSGTDEALSKSLKHTKYKIVGTCYNPNYLSYEKGSSNIGSGTVNSFIYIQNTNVLKDYYTEVDVCVKGAKDLNCYSDEYFDVVDPVLKKIKKISNKQINARIQSYQSELDEKKQEATDKFKDAENQFNNAQNKIDSGLSEIQSNELKLQNSKDQINQGWNEYYANLQLLDNIPTLQNAIAQIEESEKKLPELLSQKEQVENGLQQINAEGDLNTKRTLIQNAIDFIDIALKKLENYPDSSDAETIRIKLNEKKELLQGQLSLIDQAIAKKAELEAILPQIQSGIEQIQAGVAKKAELQSQLNQLLNAKNELNNAYVSLINGQAQYEDGVSKIEDAKNELNKSIEQLTLSKAEFNIQKHDALRELSDAQLEIDKMEGKWIVLDRNSHYSYRDYGACADRMDGIAKVFPVFFFLVAALVCMTTMTRMVDEQRNEMGTLKALGYSKLQIASKYIIYALIASILGSILGCSLGMYLFPTVIFNAWNTLYNIDQIKFLFQPGLILLASGSVTGITLLATLYSIYSELIEMPSQLMRPKAAKAGKKILLERITFIWKRLSFLQKVTARNIFRYKKRFFMTIIGIAGCSALLVAGFGINDSISDIVNQQYNVIYHYDATVSAKTSEITSQIKSLKGVKDVYEEDHLAVTTKIENKDISTTVHIISNDKKFKDFCTLFNGNKEFDLDDSSVLISQKMATKLNKKAGDTIKIKDANNKVIKAKIKGVFTNYVGHHIYASESLYKSWNTNAKTTHIYLIKSKKTTKKFERNLGNKIMNIDGVQSVTFYSSLQKNFKDMIKSISYIVVVLVISAACLAFVVLYNLSNVNISERKREIATIKVLGFTRKEVDAYINRETILLTILGSLIGLGIGIGLHHLIMNLAEMDDIMFGRTINSISYVISFVMTIGFNAIINLCMHKKLNNIQMVESLKAVE
ncbi:FtsX-like permease family protein [Holdemanella biformis]|uniref:FtsX-like permease family protein n=1 Tax=Holdemanella biformis TaxID=1735 RepID=UPI001C38B301|nr:FtsX-like permease family protein [Holdemanella biformis]MBV4131105.1 ABC transporter permease [Holdemanella biformis]MBV4150887.1 ABC transporter permease [Holdemanella biformis]